MVKVLMVGLGGFLGAISRYLLRNALIRLDILQIPWGTFVVNILGCFLIGIIYSWSERFGTLSAEWRIFLSVGFCGSFTTFSTFADENLGLIQMGNIWSAGLYTFLSLAAGITGVLAGILLVRAL